MMTAFPNGPLPPTAFFPGRDVHFVDFDRTDQVKERRIKRFTRALNALLNRLVDHSDFALKLAEARIKPEKRVN